MILLLSPVRTGRWASVMPETLTITLGLTYTIRAVPIIEPDAAPIVGLVALTATR